MLDAAAREQIRTSLDETLAVEAAAGTGKTTVLVDRIVNVLAAAQTTVDRLVAVTFTEKAAGELKLRLRTELDARRATADASIRLHLDAALERLEQAHVSTIHTFCADLLRERPVEAGVDPQFTMLTEPQAERLFGQVFREWLQQRLEAPPAGVRRALRRSGFDDDGGPTGRLQRAAWTLAEWRDFEGAWRRDPSFDRASRIQTLADELAAFDEVTREPSDREDALFVSTAAARRLHSELTFAEQVRPRDHDGLEARLVDLCSWSFRNARIGRKAAPYRRGLPRTEVVSAHQRLVAMLEAFKRDADADLAALLRDELVEVIGHYREAKARLGALDFLDLLASARDLVRDHDGVRAAFQSRFTHLFVDEFQDTDPLQAEILLLLASRDPATRNWREVAPRPGKLFVVGDPKQSIYRFRRADVGIYEEVREQLRRHGAACLELTTSFRSVPTIQRAVNAAFAPRMTGNQTTRQASYVALSPVRDDIPGQPAVVALPVPRPLGWRDQVTKRAVSESLPDAVGAWVGWLVTRSGWRVTDRKCHEPRPVTARDVCLLFRRFDTRVYGRTGSQIEDVTRAYVEALEARGIPHLLVGGKSFHDREEIETMRTALAAIEWPDDELSVFGTVRGALFAVGDEALYEYRASAGRVHPFRRPDGTLPAQLQPIGQALDLLRDLHVRRNHRPVAETIARLLEASRAHAIFALRPSGEQALANVQFVAELARQYEAGGGLSFRGFVDQLQDEAESTRAAEAPILEEGSDGVRIMTAHRAKGLEFPVVVLADITAELSRSTASRFVDSSTGRFAVSLAGWAPADLLDHEATEVARDAAEGVRVAYVAATRARDLLVVPTVGDQPFESGWISPLNEAVYPPVDTRREPAMAPWCEGFGPDSAVDREGTAPYSSVRPGVHTFASSGSEASYDITWWDPGALDLDRQPSYGLRREELIAKDAPDGVVELGLQRFRSWSRAHEASIEEGSRASIRVLTVRARATQPDQAIDDLPAVRVEQARAHAAARSAGPRFGALVHALLAAVPLDADAAVVADLGQQHARVLDATDAEVADAERVVADALQHPLLARARQAWTEGRARREVPVSLREPSGTIVEGVVDLAFEDEGGWTVVDFKTDQELGTSLDTYLRQVQIYAAAIARATGRSATGVLLRI